MNELFFSAMFIGSLLFGNPETKEIPSELNINQMEIPQADPKGKLELISNTKTDFTFKLTGDQTNDRLEILINDQLINTSIDNGQFTLSRPEKTENNSFKVDVKANNSLNSKSYASYVISF